MATSPLGKYHFGVEGAMAFIYGISKGRGKNKGCIYLYIPSRRKALWMLASSGDLRKEVLETL